MAFSAKIRRTALLGAAVALVATGGCSLLPQFGPPPAVGPPYMPTASASEDSSAVVLSSADSAVTAVNKAFQGRVKPGTTVYPDEHSTHPGAAGASAGLPAATSHRSGHKGGALEPDSSAATDTTGISQSADSIGPSVPPALSVDMPALAQEQLEIQARANSAWADSTATVQARRALAPSDRDKLETAFGLSKQSREAMERGDLQAAANLAYKARLLVEEVARR
jgi:hypothetical protein